AIAEINPNVVPSTGLTTEIELTPVPNGVYMSDIIVLLTDGASNQGPLPLDAAQQAVDRGIRVYPIGFGTASGSIMDCSSFGGGPSFGGGFGGGGFRRGIDEETLKEIADMTGGTYFSAESAGELQDIFQELPTYLITKRELREISVAFTIIGALLMMMTFGLSLIWHPLP
ncbi:MAG: VWA domain-containing protein, partial [Anaerolineae bacterium]|nr:VWA domain-containing protein [Anaerolineae bacterium]